MSSSSKAGPSRIPSFGFRLPQLRSTTQSSSSRTTPTDHQIPTVGFKIPTLRGTNTPSKVTEPNHPDLNATKVVEDCTEIGGAKNVLTEINKAQEQSSIKNTIKKLVQSVSSSHSKENSAKTTPIRTESASNVENQRLTNTDENNPAAQPQNKITSKHIGKKVRVGDKEGVLRYVGIVHFAKGSWCGVELSQPIGKHDGLVNGMRYFSCADQYGLMAPIFKVTPIESSCESLEDHASGPYSMLFFDNNFTQKENQNNFTQNLDRDRCNQTKTFNVERQNTFELHDSPNFKEKLSKTLVQNETDFKNPNDFLLNKTLSIENLDQSLDGIKNSTFNLINTTKSIENLSELQESFIKKGNSTYDIFNNLNNTVRKSIQNLAGNTTYDLITCSTENLHQANTTFDLKDAKNQLNHTISYENKKPVLDRQNTFEVVKIDETLTACSFTNTKKRTNETFDSDNDTLTKSDNLEQKGDTELLLPAHKSCEDLTHEATVEVKRRRTSNLKNTTVENIVLRNLPLIKPNSLPQLKSVHLEEGNHHSTPVRGGFIENPSKSWRISDIRSSPGSSHSKEEFILLNKDDDQNKRNSLDCEDCSLGILTPDQMPDFAQTRSPSLEYNVFDISKLLGRQGSANDLRNAEREAVVAKQQNTTVSTTQAIAIPTKSNHLELKEDVQSPNCNSITDYSLGIIDVHMMSTFNTLETDTTINLDLPLDSVGQISKDLAITRCDQTPSPEELPLDTTPIVESEPSSVKTELPHNTELTEPSENLSSSQKSSKPSISYVASITTSITSLDTGYQGDGEMSRPASRGADNSPLTRRPLPRPQPRRPDPMTDSDFYTESDADNHEDNQYKESRRAQVIDGTLYGVDPQAAADIYVNNRENMDSSGIFTDIESAGNGRNEDEEENERNVIEKDDAVIVTDISPTESTTKSISVNSQDNIQEFLHKSTAIKPIEEKENSKPTKELVNPKKRNAPSPGLGSPTSLSSPRHLNKESHDNIAKKYKMPKRDVASKVKTMLDTNKDSAPQSERKPTKKPAGRWDAVMNKISKNEQPNLKDVKSKVFSSATPTVEKRTSEVRKSCTRTSVGSQSTKNRRVRTRTSHALSPLKSNSFENHENSIHSSLSDLSASIIPTKKTPVSAKKRDTIQVTQVLTPSKLSRTQTPVNENNKKNAANSNLTTTPSSNIDVKVKRNIFSPKEKKQIANANNVTKDCGKPVIKGGRTSPTVRPPSAQTNYNRASNNLQPPPVTVKNQYQQTALVSRVPAPKAAEALAVLVHHLVFNVEAYQVPHLRRQVEKLRLEAEEVRLACQNLEETLSEERLKQSRLIEEERTRCRKDIMELIEKHRSLVEELTSQQSEILAEKDSAHQYLILKHEEQLGRVRTELDKLQRSHQETLDILREENDAIREQIDEKQLELEKAKDESLKLKNDYERKEIKLKSELQQQLEKLERQFEEKLTALNEEKRQLREENDRLLSYGDEKGSPLVLQEVQSLRVVLELKQTEVTELRKSLAQATQKLELLSGAEERATTLQARCEDLELQLQRKKEFEQSLIKENQKLQDSFQEEINQKKRLYQRNEELDWKLKQSKEVVTKVVEGMVNYGGAEDVVEVFNRSNSLYSSSFNEKHSSTNRSNLDRTFSFRERSLSNKSNISLDGLGCHTRTRKSKNSISELFDMDDVSPPTSPKVKGVVEKSDSVSYVLDLDESPEVVANRIVRRSFRNSTPPKNNTPTKSPSNKRPRMRNPLSMSASSSAIVTPTSGGGCQNDDRPRSASERDGKGYDEVFLWDHAQSTPKINGHGNDSMKLEDQDHLDLEDTIEDMQLPALPSEIDKRNGVLALPSPKHLAADLNGASDSNSEDESTSSSQL